MIHIFTDCDSIITEIAGSASTIVSVALSVIAMISSSKTEKKTSQTLNEIKEQNVLLVKKIHNDLIRENFDDNNIEDLVKSSTLPDNSYTH